MKAKPAIKSKRVVPPESILDDHIMEIRAIAEALRKLVRATLPEAIESGHPTWHSIGYRHPKAGYVCGIFPHKDSVDLVFEFGIIVLVQKQEHAWSPMVVARDCGIKAEHFRTPPD